MKIERNKQGLSFQFSLLLKDEDSDEVLLWFFRLFRVVLPCVVFLLFVYSPKFREQTWGANTPAQWMMLGAGMMYGAYLLLEIISISVEASETRGMDYLAISILVYIAFYVNYMAAVFLSFAYFIGFQGFREWRKNREITA